MMWHHYSTKSGLVEPLPDNLTFDRVLCENSRHIVGDLFACGAPSVCAVSTESNLLFYASSLTLF